jgi:putative endonuclease
MFYVYVLQSKKDGKLYTGFTSDLKKRLLKHNFGKVFSTKNRRPLLCIYVEICLNEKDAKIREKYLKSGTGKRYLKQRLYYYFQRENTLFPTGFK